MHDSFEVQVVTEERITTTQRIVTAVLTVYFLFAAGGIAVALFFSFSRT